MSLRDFISTNVSESSGQLTRDMFDEFWVKYREYLDREASLTTRERASRHPHSPSCAAVAANDLSACNCGTAMWVWQTEGIAIGWIERAILAHSDG